MNINHLALPSRNIIAQQTFYCTYFGFHVAWGGGFLTNDAGFVLVLDTAINTSKLPEGLHFGFHSSDPAEVHNIYRRMMDNGVTMIKPLTEQNGMVTFFCADPEGYTVEVRAVPSR